MAVEQESIDAANARNRLEQAARRDLEVPCFEGTGIVVCAGGPFVPSAYVVVRLLRDFGTTLPIEVWHAGEDEIPTWARHAFGPLGVTLKDATTYYPDRPQRELRGWPLKPAALMKSSFRHVMFLDADCFPLRNMDFLFESAAYAETGALFWPDNKHHKMVENGTIWDLTGLSYQGDSEFETGLFVVDKQRCWRELCLVQWMNANSVFWYDHVMGDKDTFYLGWRKQGAPYFLGPPCKRFNALITRHFWTDGRPLVDHRSGTSKYAMPRRKGPFSIHLTPYKYRPPIKNVYDEVMQRFVVRNFRQHTRYLADLARVHNQFA